jgi:ribosomal protein L37E
MENIERVMDSNCVHCSQNINENFCSNCGQKRYKRIDRKYIWDEIQYTLVHVNKGFLYSVKSIIKNPGKTAREYIAGDRVSHYKPLSLAFVLASISALISINVVKLSQNMETVMVDAKLNSTFMQETMQYINKYNSYIMLLFVPIVAVFTKFVFRKWGNNYYEHIVMNAIGVAHYCLAGILLLYPVLYFFKDNPPLLVQVSLFSFVLIPILMVIFFKGFYNDKPLKSIIWRIFLIILMLLAIYLLSIVATIVFILITKDAGAVEYMKAR